MDNQERQDSHRLPQLLQGHREYTGLPHCPGGGCSEAPPNHTHLLRHGDEALGIGFLEGQLNILVVGDRDQHDSRPEGPNVIQGCSSEDEVYCVGEEFHTI